MGADNKELEKLLRRGAYRERSRACQMDLAYRITQRDTIKVKFDNRFDIVSGADSRNGVVYIDRRIPQFSPKLRDKYGRPANLWKYLGIHEVWEEAAMARGYTYDRAHERVGTPMERRAAEQDGVNWQEYTKEIDGYLDKIEKEKVTRPPPHGLHVDPQQAIKGDHPHHHHRSHNKK